MGDSTFANPDAGLLKKIDRIINKKIKDLENKIGQDHQKNNADLDISRINSACPSLSPSFRDYTDIFSSEY